MGSPEAMGWEPSLAEPDEATTVELSDAVLEYLDDSAADIVRTIGRHYQHGRDHEAETLTRWLVGEIERFVPGTEDVDSGTINTIVEDTMMALLG
jgi:hypothetical protein